jgi:hypothetical protein
MVMPQRSSERGRMPARSARALGCGLVLQDVDDFSARTNLSADKAARLKPPAYLVHLLSWPHSSRYRQLVVIEARTIAQRR